MDKVISKKVSRINRWLRALPVWQNALIASACWLWMLTLLGELNHTLFPPIFAASLGNLNEPLITQYIILCVIVVFFVEGCFIGPVCFVGWGIHHIVEYFKYQKKGDSLLRQIAEYIGWVAAPFILVLFPLGIFVIAEELMLLSLLPFATLLSSLLWIPWGMYLTRNISKIKSTAIISIVIILVLSLPYLDWSSRKTFIRDLSNIRYDMTGIEVERLMKNHRHNFAQPEEEHLLHLNPAYTGDTVFRPRHSGDMGIIEFQDGKVVGLKFEAD
jgi:hypothetical protein